MSGDIVLDAADRPGEIEARSLEIIDAEAGNISPYRGRLWEVARRCIHALGDVDIIHDLCLNEAALASGLAALKRGCAIYTDTRMLAAGLVDRRMLPLAAKVFPLMALPGLGEMARKAGSTRARCGMKMIAARAAGQIVAIGNAPTALLGLLDELEGKSLAEGPALIVGMPVGFVNARQSKELLARSSWPNFILKGRKGGSAAAAACINALADIALREKGLRAREY